MTIYVLIFECEGQGHSLIRPLFSHDVQIILKILSTHYIWPKYVGFLLTDVVSLNLLNKRSYLYLSAAYNIALHLLMVAV